MAKNYIERMKHFIESKIIPLRFREGLFNEGELEKVLEQIRDDKTKYEKETGKPYKIPLA